MILVTGATGNVGAEVVAALGHLDRPVRALVRDPASARASLPATVEVVPGDLDRPGHGGAEPSTASTACSCSAASPHSLTCSTRMRSAGVGHVAATDVALRHRR